MEQDTLTHFKKLLETERATLETELRSIGRINPDNPNDWEARPTQTEQEADPGDRADNVENYEENTAILRELEIRFNEVKDALAKIEKGTYGVCEAEGELIDEKRLEANPAARTCVEHASQEA